MIQDLLIEEVKNEAQKRTLKDVRLGLGYSGVLLDNDSCGVAYTFRNELGPSCSIFASTGGLIGRCCEEIIHWAKDIDLAKATVGIATINALLQNNIKEYEQYNLFEKLDITSNDNLGVVGNFLPLTNGKGKKAKKMFVFERDDNHRTDNVYPDYAIDMYLPQCDIAVITATSIINKTFDHVIEKCTNARQIVVVGPTTPLCPDVMKQYGVNIIGGVKVVDPESLLRTISQGGGTRSFGKAVDQVVITI